MSKPPRSRRRKRQGKVLSAPLELVEEAFHLLRSTPLKALWLYYLGSVPFVLAVFYFWADMSRSSYAARDAALGALGVAATYFWMKGWQGLFCRRLWAQLLPAGKLPPLPGRRVFALFAAQAFLHSFSFPLLLVSMIFAGWVFAFFQNASALAFTQDFEGRPLRKLIRQSARLSHFGWGQNHLVLLVMCAVGFFAWINIVGSLALIPTAIKMFFGIESVFTLNPLATLLNTTFLFGSFLITYLVLDPLVKAAYVLRCFYGISQETGADLLSRLAPFQERPPRDQGSSPRENPSRKGVAALLVFSLTFLSFSGQAQESGPAEATEEASLETSIENVLQQKQYQWRLSRQKVGDTENEEQSWLTKVLSDLADSVERIARRIGKAVEELLDKIFDTDRSTERKKNTTLSAAAVSMVAKILMVALVGVLLIWLIMILAKRAGGSRPDNLDASVAGGPIDLESENIVASQLPEDEWMRLAREQIQKGENRLAVRALFLASLAHLGERGLIRVARFKSNRDYTRELDLKAHSHPELRTAFDENVGLFERAWYGLHQIGAEAIDHFIRNYEHITRAPSAPGQTHA